MSFNFSNLWANRRWYAAFSKLKASGTPEEARAAQRVMDALMKAPVDDSDEPVQVGSVKPGEPAHVILTPHGVVVNEAEGATVHGLDGSAFLMRPDGSVEISNPAVERIEIHNASVVSSVSTHRVFQTNSHIFEFYGGGTLSFVTDATGKIIEIHAKSIRLSQDNQTKVMTVYGTPIQGAASA